MTNGQIGKKINRTKSAVQNKAKELGLKRESKFDFNKEAFSKIDNQDIAYWIGFIYADGYVWIDKKTRHYELGIELAKRDCEHLKKFNKFLNGNLQVKYRMREGLVDKSKINEMSIIKLYSKQIVQDLISYGVIPNKTYESNENILNNIPNQFKIDFIRGFLDGDGWITKKGKRFGMCSVNIELLKGIQRYLNIEYGIKSILNLSGRAKENGRNLDLYSITMNSKESKNFGELLYNNANTYLDRKYKIYKKYNQ